MVEHRLEIQRLEVRTSSGAQNQFVRVFQSQNTVLTHQCANPVWIRTNKNDHVCTLNLKNLQSVRSSMDYANRKTLPTGGGKKLGSAVLCLLVFPMESSLTFPCIAICIGTTKVILSYFILLSYLQAFELWDCTVSVMGE